MRKLSKKSMLLVGGILTVCAFAMPSLASAASWSPIPNTTHVLASHNLAFTAGAGGAAPVGSQCADSEFHAVVVNAAVMEITAVSFRNCTGLAGTLGSGCTTTATATGLPWTATARTTTDIQIHNIDVDVQFETRPGGPLGSCLLHNNVARVTGTLTGGTFDPSTIAANRRVTFNHAHGLTSHSALGSQSAFVTGTFRDTTNTLNVLD